MSTTTLQAIRHSLAVVAAAAFVTACAGDAPLGPDRHVTLAVAPDLGECDSLQVPAGSKIVSQLYAEGAQVYRWNGASWAFVAPDAVLFANANSNGVVG